MDRLGEKVERVVEKEGHQGDAEMNLEAERFW